MSTNQQNIESFEALKMENVKELMQILTVYNKLMEKQQINLLMEQMKEMQKNYTATQKELASVKKQLNKVQLKNLSQEVAKPPEQNSLLQITNEAEDKLAKQHDVLKKTGENMNKRARQIVEKFKNIGIIALNNVCEFLGIKEKLIALRDCARSNEMTMKSSVEKIEKVESEFGTAKFHAKNAIRVLAGKETLQADIEKKSKFFETLKKLYMKRQEKYAQRCEKLDKAIGKFDSLEKAADAVKVKNRNSVIDKLSDNKKILDVKAAEQKDALQQEKSEKHHENPER